MSGPFAAVPPAFTRRAFLKSAVAATAASPLASVCTEADDDAADPIPVSAVVTEYRDNSHADVIVGKILAGFDQKGGPGPGMKLVSLYVDQFPEHEMSRELARKYGFSIAPTIREALTLGTDALQVRGVLSIGEHGKYPFTPRTGQHIYPRFRFFSEIAETFRACGQVAPVFNDKHLSYSFDEAARMHRTAADMKIPLMAGSSLPVTWRKPPLALPIGTQIDEALAIGYGGLESYGFHALETLQCMVERRAGGEVGVESVQAVKGEEIIKARDRGDWSEALLAAALQTLPGAPPVDLAKLNQDAAFYLLRYRDGLRATVAMINGLAGEFAFAARLRGQERPAATWFELQNEKPFGHFGHLLRAIESMLRSGKPAYPVERTLLTTGVLDEIMQSLADGGTLRKTPRLAIRYAPTEWGFANRDPE
jgi:hypothetical protein